MRPQKRADGKLAKERRPYDRTPFALNLNQGNLQGEGYAKWRKSQNNEPDSNAATGRVNTQAAAMFRRVDICNPLRLAAMVPAMPELKT